MNDVLCQISMKREQNQNFVQNKILQMTLYKHLGPITFESETQMFEVFSASDQTLILQFKHYEDIVIDQLTELLAVYQLILKEDKLLEIYTEKNKPSSILLHTATRVSFDKITIQLLCRIIKETVVSIFHSTKLIPGKIGQITPQMFFEINGQLRFLYFPVKKYNPNQQNLVSDVFDLFNQLKDDKEISHRLLLKKISKCNSLEQILDETQYFLSIYHARQSNTLVSTIDHQSPAQNSFFVRTLTKTKLGVKNLNESSANEFRNSHFFGQNVQIYNSKINPRRKYNLFKNTDYRNNLSPQHTFSSNTWRKTKKQHLFQNNTFRTNSKAVHIDLSQRGVKNQSASLFNRAASFNQTPKKLSNSKRKCHGMSLHSHTNQNYIQNNESLVRNKNNFSRRSGTQQIFQSNQVSRMNESSVSKRINESQCKINYQEQNCSENSEWMKKMVNNSLEKWRQKSNQKGKIFSKMNDKDREGSTQVDSRSKFVQKYERPSYNMLHESNVSSIHHKNFLSKNQSYKQSDAIPYQTYGSGSEKKLKRMTGNRSALVDSQKIEKTQVIQKIEKGPEEFQFCYNQNTNHPSHYDANSSIQIDLCKSSIEHLAMINKQEELRLSRGMERKKTSIKEIAEGNNMARHVSDQSQTQRIQYSRCSKKNFNTKPQSQQSNKSISLYKNEIQHFENKLKQIFVEKAQIDYIGVAVVQTTQHLKSFESIFWQLPMFFLYKKFYEKRLKLCQKISDLHSQTSSALRKSKDFKQIEAKVGKYYSEIEPENISIEECLKKLLKTVKKKIKKEYAEKEQQKNIEKHLHLDYTIDYDKVIDDFVLAYINSLLEAKEEFQQLTYHIIEILEAVSVIKGKKVDPKDRGAIEQSKSKSSKLISAETYYQTILKRKQIKSLFNPSKPKGKEHK